MLGNAVYRELRGDKTIAPEGWSQTTKQSADRLPFLALDLADLGGAPFRLLERADLVIHCAAMTDADYCERHPEEARVANAFVPEWLAQAQAKHRGRFVYVSTDAVYDDSQPGRRKETDQPNPQSVYAKTKLEGEGRVLAAYPEALVVRTTMFGWTLPTAPRPKFAEQILAALTARQPIKLFRDAYFSPLYVSQLAEILLMLAEEKASGVLNVGSRHPVSKSHFGRLIAAYFGLDDSLIEEVSVDDVPLAAKRTKNVSLDLGRFQGLLGPAPLIGGNVQQLYEDAHDGTAKRVRGRETYP